MSSGDIFLVAVGVGILAVLIILIVLFKSTWRIAEPDEALIISGISGGKSASGTRFSSSHLRYGCAAAMLARFSSQT